MTQLKVKNINNKLKWKVVKISGGSTKELNTTVHQIKSQVAREQKVFSSVSSSKK